MASMNPEHTAIVYVACVLIVGCCGHVVPWLSVIGYLHLFLAEKYYGPPCARMKLKRKVVKPMSDSLYLREFAEEVRNPRRGLAASTELREF
jgi:hypothetical protein